MNPVDKQSLNDITLEDLEAILSGDPEELGVHLQLVDRDIVVEGHMAASHRSSKSPVWTANAGVTMIEV